MGEKVVAAGNGANLVRFNDVIVSLSLLKWESFAINLHVNLFSCFSETCWTETRSPSLILVSLTPISHTHTHTHTQT